MKSVQESIELSVASAASKTTVAGTAVTTISWFNSSNFGMWMGIAIGLAGFLVNAYFKHQANKRAKEAHQAYMESLKRGRHVLPEKQEADE